MLSKYLHSVCYLSYWLPGSLDNLLNKISWKRSAKPDFGLFAKKYSQISRAQNLYRLHLLFNKSQRKFDRSLQILREHAGQLESEGIDLVQEIKSTVLSGLGSVEKQKVVQWVIGNLDFLNKRCAQTTLQILLKFSPSFLEFGDSFQDYPMYRALCLQKGGILHFAI